MAMPFSSTSSTRLGSSDCTWGAGEKPSSPRSGRNWLTAVPLANCAGAGTDQQPRKQASAKRAASHPMPRRSAGRLFFEESVEKTVVITQGIVRDATGNPPALRQQMPRGGQQTRVGVVRKERIDLVHTFLLENRTGAIQ